MSIYSFIVIVFIVIKTIGHSIKSRKVENALYVFSVLLLVFVSGFRYEVGSDYNTYIDLFHTAARTFIVGEPLLSIITVFFNYLNEEQLSTITFFFYSLVTISLISAFYSRFSDDKLLSLLIFVSLPILYLSSLNVVRQFLAVGFFAYSLRYLVDKKLFQYIICVALSAAAHKSALLLLPAYFLFKIRFSLLSYLTITVVFFASLNFLPIIISYSGFSLIYLDLYKSEGINAMSLLMLLFFIIYLFCFFKYGEKGRGNDCIWLNMIFASVLISFSPLFSEFAGLVFLRLSTYFTFILPVVIVRIKYYLNGVYIRFIYQVCVVVILLLYFYITLFTRGESLRLVPYNCIFC